MASDSKLTETSAQLDSESFTPVVVSKLIGSASGGIKSALYLPILYYPSTLTPTETGSKDKGNVMWYGFWNGDFRDSPDPGP
jgi:hypothetical protein